MMALDSNVSLPVASASSRWLLGSLFLSLMVLPLLEGLSLGRTLQVVGISVTCIVAAVAARPRFRPIALMFLAVLLPATWATLFVDSTYLFVAHCLLGSVFFWLVGGVIVFVVIKTHTINLDSVFAAISAYLLFGLAWALSYWAIYTVSPSSFPTTPNHEIVGPDGVTATADFSHFVYYSFVTMSTLGYGDITAQDRITRTLSWVQSVTGQFYVAVVIAWLVSALPRPNDSRQAVAIDE